MARAEGRGQDVPGGVVSTKGRRAWYQKCALSKVSNANGEKRETKGLQSTSLQGDPDGWVSRANLP